MELLEEHTISLDAERAVLGAMLHWKKVSARVVQRLTEESFCSPEHRQIFQVAAELTIKSVPPPAPVVEKEIKPRGIVCHIH